MKKIKKFLYLALLSALIFAMLYFPSQSLYFALTGLDLWFQKMVPTLLPFMIISSLMISLQLSTSFMRLFSPLLTPIFRVKKDVLYGIFIGFLCGFPMGAKTSSQLYQMGKISKKEANYLLSFTNNIGPIYFLSFVLVNLEITEKMPYLFGMYGIPLLYGILLRYTYYKNLIPDGSKTHVIVSCCNDNKVISLLDSIDSAITGSLTQITILGGYMIFFNILNLIPYLLGLSNSLLGGIINIFLEITSGISILFGSVGNISTLHFVIFTGLAFGGLSCMAQTYSIIKGGDLSFKSYMTHKLIIWALTCAYYFVIL